MGDRRKKPTLSLEEYEVFVHSDRIIARITTFPSTDFAVDRPLIQQSVPIPNMEAELVGRISQIPVGRVTTYGAIARSLGDVVASRWVGKYLLHHTHARNGDLENCACHRVVRADGAVGGYLAGDQGKKEALLQSEGVTVAGHRVELSQFGFDGFSGSAPLEYLKALQNQFARQTRLERPANEIRVVAGVDVSYVPETSDAVAAYAEVDLSEKRLIWSETVRNRVDFPYISSFLAFRELPLLIELIERVTATRPLADLLLVDGSGVLHPRRAGIATMLGVALGLTTVGVTKKHLAGKVGVESSESGIQPISLHDRLMGTAIRPSTRSTSKSLYVSPGHGVDVATATDVVLKLIGNRRLPEPIYWADRLSRLTARMCQSERPA